MMHKLFIVVCVTVFEFAYCGRQYNLPYDDGIFLKGAQIGLGISMEKSPVGKYDKDDYLDSQIAIVKPGEDDYGKYGYGYDVQPYKKDVLQYDAGYGYGSAYEKIPVFSLDKYAGLSKLSYGKSGYEKGAPLYADDEPEQEKGYTPQYSEGLKAIPGKFKEIYFDGGYGKLDFKKYSPVKAYAASRDYESYAPSKAYSGRAEAYESVPPLDAGYGKLDLKKYAPVKAYGGDFESYAPSKAYSGRAEAYESGPPLDLSGYGKTLAAPSYKKAAQLSDYGREDLRAAYSKAYDRLAAYERESQPVVDYGRGYDAGYDEEPPRYARRY